MPKQVPFLKLFSAFPQVGPLGETVSHWEVTGAAIDKKGRAIKARVLCPALPAEQRRKEVETRGEGGIGTGASAFCGPSL